MGDFVGQLAKELDLNPIHTKNALNLLVDEECTIPFVARYRKEVTGSMDEVNLRNLKERYEYLLDLENSKNRYLKVVEEHCKVKPEFAGKFPELKAKFDRCTTKQELDDLYLPFKPKRRTKAQIAKEKGLEPLLDKILAERNQCNDLLAIAQEFVTPEGSDIEKELHVANAEDALAGAAHILSERVSENADYRSLVRDLSYETGFICSERLEQNPTSATSSETQQSKKKSAQPSKYENYFEYRESINSIVSHRIMAIRRGELEKILRVNIEVDKDRIIQELQAKVLGQDVCTDQVKEWICKTVEDSYKRLIGPSIETEIRLHLKYKGEEEAIKVFSKNLEKLLLLPPIPKKVVMGIDPGLRTGCKIAVVSETGKLLEHAIIYPYLKSSTAEHPDNAAALKTVLDLINKHGVGFIAIGNGTGSREIDQLIIKLIKSNSLDVKRLVVNEAGASVYSTDEIAREEFPDLDPTIRSAVSIARRLQDPLAELVKIDPKSIGVGQYQHDCNVVKLNRSLKDSVESCVNKVGVDVNTASYKLLSYVSGIGPSLARSIVQHRDENGPFSSREWMRKVSGYGPKAFQQSAGFLRIPGGENPLDNSAVHPERYSLVEQIAQENNIELSKLVGNKDVVETIPLEKYVSDTVGMPTLLDISSELIKPGRDPRAEGSRLTYSDNVATMEDLKLGMKLKGTVSNVTNFGAFVDIGVHQDGLVHISELSDTFVEDPSKVVAVGDILDVYVIQVDKERKRIGLSCKQPNKNLQQQDRVAGSANNRASQDKKERTTTQRSYESQRKERNGASNPRRNTQHQSRTTKQTVQKKHSMDDLLNKFNSNRA